MSNPNYNRGVRFERKVKAEYEALGYTVLRTAGSHGKFDLIALHSMHSPKAIQCKVLKTGTQKRGDSLVLKFLAKPPLPISSFYIQVLAVYNMKDKTRSLGGC